MRRIVVISFFVFVVFPLGVSAQESKAASPLNETQGLGRRVFEQRCAVCHTQVTQDATKTWGPLLNKDLVQGNEDVIRQFISNGVPGRMPGFKYGLKPEEINAIIEYLKTLPKRTLSKGNKDNPDLTE